MLTKREYSPKEWLTYYKNIWVKNVVARTIDVDTDKVLKATDPEQMVPDNETGKLIPVKERLETRKIAIQDALDLIAGIDRLLAFYKEAPEGSTDTDKAFVEKYWSKDALKVDTDMLPKEPKVGDPCQLDNGQGEGVYAMMEDKLVCVVKDEKPGDAAPSSEAKV